MKRLAASLFLAAASTTDTVPIYVDAGGVHIDKTAPVTGTVNNTAVFNNWTLAFIGRTRRGDA